MDDYLDSDHDPVSLLESSTNDHQRNVNAGLLTDWRERGNVWVNC